jgi:hypothetical protein
MKKLLAAVALFGGSMAMVPAPAHAGGSTDAALALGAFAVLNQIVRGETIFQAPRPVVVQQPIVVQQPVIVGPPPVVYVPPPPPPVVYAPPPVYAPPVRVVVYPRAYAPYYGYYHAQYRRHYQYDDD